MRTCDTRTNEPVHRPCAALAGQGADGCPDYPGPWSSALSPDPSTPSTASRIVPHCMLRHDPPLFAGLRVSESNGLSRCHPTACEPRLTYQALAVESREARRAAGSLILALVRVVPGSSRASLALPNATGRWAPCFVSEGEGWSRVGRARRDGKCIGKADAVALCARVGP